MTQIAKAAGMSCPVCGNTEPWFNGVPLRAFCWGGKAGKSEHNEWGELVPPPFNPYLPPNLAGRTPDSKAAKR